MQYTHTRGVPQTAIATCTKAGQSPDQRRWTRFRVVAPFSARSSAVLSTFWASQKSKDKLPNLTDLHRSPTSHSLSVKHLVFLSMSKHNRAVETEFLSSGSPQGLSSPMLVVIFLSCHCSLLCSPSFLIILSAIYQTMKSERKKKLNLSLFCIMAYVKFFEEKCFVCSLFLWRKKRACCL